MAARRGGRRIGETTMLMVTGANGNLGGRVIANLLDLVGPSGFVAGSRDPASPFARALEAKGVAVRRADFDDPQGLPAAFEGVEAALIISTYAPNSQRAGQNLGAIEAAKAAGVSAWPTPASPGPARAPAPTTPCRSTGRPSRR
jgi:NAD(P)H dehydrogenase (quinone)